MKAKMNLAMVALALTMGVCLLLSPVARAQSMQCTGQPDEPITYGNIVTCSISAPGDSQTFTFNGAAGERVEIVMSSSSYAPCVELVGVATACGNQLQGWIDTVLAQTQQYTIKTYDYFGSGTLNYTLALERAAPPSSAATQITYGNNSPGQINPLGDIGPFFFAASVGDVVDITVASGSYAPCIKLYSPDAMTTWTGCGNNIRNEITTQALTVAGNYSILVYDYFPYGTLSYNVNLQCFAGPCHVTLIPDVSGYLTLRGTPLAGAGVSLSQPGAPGPQLTRTDNNGYYQFLHIIAGETFNVLIHGSADPGAPASSGPASAGTADNKRQDESER